MLKMAITAICEKCSDTKEIVVNTRDINKRFKLSDLLGGNIQYMIEGKGVCKKCNTKYLNLIEKQKKELADFIGKKEQV